MSYIAKGKAFRGPQPVGGAEGLYKLVFSLPPPANKFILHFFERRKSIQKIGILMIISNM